MHHGSSNFSKIVRCSAAVLIVLWWGGLNCLTGCALMQTETDAVNECALSATGDCCQTQATHESAPSVPSVDSPSTSFQSPACCALEAYVAETSREVRNAGSVALVPAAHWNRSVVTHAMPTQPPHRWARVPDRGSTYLLVCVFLI